MVKQLYFMQPIFISGKKNILEVCKKIRNSTKLIIHLFLTFISIFVLICLKNDKNFIHYILYFRITLFL